MSDTPLRLKALLEQPLRQCRRRTPAIALAALGLLGGFAVTAFGIAPLTPTVPLPPPVLVQESLDLDHLAEQLEALALRSPLEFSRSTLTRSNDSVDTVLARLGVSDPGASAFIRSDPLARKLIEGRAGKMVQASLGEDGSLYQLIARYAAEGEAALSHFMRLSVVNSGGRWQSEVEQVELEAQIKLASGTIQTNLFAATDEAHLSDRVAMQLVEMFSTDIDFHRELRKGDSFTLAYESVTADGQPVTWAEGAGRVLAAEFINDGRTHQALWFTDRKGKPAYFDFDGRSKRRSILASPLVFSRLSSGFSMRMHPITNAWRKHLGVDYAAPVGTAVHSVGDGMVEFAGSQNGYGNVVIIRHGHDRSTVYAHLSRVDVKRGQRVEQGDGIGAVGATGWATGPHLHFELRVKGQHQDPILAARQSESVELETASRLRFAQEAQVALARLTLAHSLGAGSRGEAD